MARKTAGSLHAHGCRRCRTRYQDACLSPEADARCTSCNGGRAWQLLIDNANPRPCCQQARLATKEERERYRLAGQQLWFICLTCARTHPFDPKRVTPGNPGEDRT